MRIQNIIFILVGTFFITAGAAVSEGAEVCATRYDEFALTPQLQAIQPYFAQNGVTGYVNETNGSYFELDTRQALNLTFMTSGPFDAFLIKKTGTVHFCDNGAAVIVKGLNRGDTIVVANGIIRLGGGGPKQTFHQGPKPEVLRRLELR